MRAALFLVLNIAASQFCKVALASLMRLAPAAPAPHASRYRSIYFTPREGARPTILYDGDDARFDIIAIFTENIWPTLMSFAVSDID